MINDKNLFPWLQIMVMYPPQPAEPVSAGFNEETGDPVQITVSSIHEIAIKTIISQMEISDSKTRIKSLTEEKQANHHERDTPSV